MQRRYMETKGDQEGPAESKTQSSSNITVENTEEGLASLRKTIEALDNFEARWKDVQRRFGEALSLSLSSAFGVQAPCTITEEEKLSVFGGKPTLANLCSKLKEGCYRRVIVMLGAGVSVSAGIPDFRSPGSGLYESLDLQRYKVPSAQAVFNIDFFRENPKPFFVLAKELFYGQAYKPTVAHYFIKLLSNRGLLHRCYTQNIDSLEETAGIPKPLLVQAHGTFKEATCTNPDCRKKYSTEKMKKVESAVMADEIPTCDTCTSGVVKPDVVFFGEDLSGRFKELLESDFNECDLLVVMGTSLQVQPFCSLTQRVKQTTPRLLINKVRVGPFTLEAEGGYRDVAMLEECDSAVQTVSELCGWSLELDALVKGPNSERKPDAKSSGGAVGGAKMTTTSTKAASSNKGSSNMGRSSNKAGSNVAVGRGSSNAGGGSSNVAVGRGGSNMAVGRGGSNVAVGRGGSNMAVGRGGSNVAVGRGGSNNTGRGGSNVAVGRGGSNAGRGSRASRVQGSVYQTNTHPKSRTPPPIAKK